MLLARGKQQDHCRQAQPPRQQYVDDERDSHCALLEPTNCDYEPSKSETPENEKSAINGPSTIPKVLRILAVFLWFDARIAALVRSFNSCVDAYQRGDSWAIFKL